MADGARGSVSRTWLRALELTADLDAAPAATLVARLAARAERDGSSVALLDAAGALTYAGLLRRARRVAAWARAANMPRGAAIGLTIGNCADYFAIWLGLSGAGYVVALLNTNLRGAALAQCVAGAGCLRFVADAAGAAALVDAGVPRGTPIHAPDDLQASPADTAEVPFDARLDDVALLIYTSGTSGLPKAARVSHRRLVTWSLWFAGLMDVTPADRMYNCLPMYHSVGGVVATGSMLVAGASVVVADRFSAHRFWADVAQHACTIFQYIGELCRYLLAAPPVPEERAHTLRLCCGNGLRGEVWAPFAARFAVPQILEFYAATEGNFSLFNVEGVPGAIGRIPSFLAHRLPVALVALDAAAEAPARGADGFCRRVARGETGEALGRIGSGGARFEGYTDAEATAKKLLRDVFEPGDLWLRSGDLMRQDAAEFFYFVDRVGGTFRWKGENVSSTDVCGVVARAPGVRAAAVYGVRVPGAEGRAGMAALVVDDTFDVAAFARRVADDLPGYARPLVLRLPSRIAETATFRPQTAALAAEGFDPARIADPLYLLRGETYVPLDRDTYAHVAAGTLRV